MAESSSIGVGLIGCGTVGSGVVKLLLEEAELYQRRLGRRLELRRVLVRPQDVHYKTEQVPREILTTDPESFFATPDMPILVELAGGRGVISQHMRRAVAMKKHVVTANKALLAAEGPELLALARQNGVSLAFEASCCGGIPVIMSLQFGLKANRHRMLAGILNGTCNYILTEMTQTGKTYAQALKEAQEKGFAEADPTLDVSGRDTAHKLAILASLAFGVRVLEEEVACRGIDKLDLADVRFGDELGYRMKLLGIAEEEETGLALAVQPCFIPRSSLLAQVYGSFNALLVCGHATGQTLYYGRGAGTMPTAAAVVSDILNIASGWYPTAFASMQIWPDQHEPARLVQPADVMGRFYLRVNALDKPGTLARISAILGRANISISAVLQHEVNVGQFVPVVILTHRVRWGDVQTALECIRREPVIEGEPVCIRILDLPEG